MNSSIGLYIHVPFCNSKCPYCDFYSINLYEDSLNAYVDKICSELLYYSNMVEKEIDTIYFGGGTPSLLRIEHFEKILGFIYKYFNVKKEIEITLEVNPTTRNNLDFIGLRTLGINRLSIGLQSANDNELKKLGRKHTVSDAENTIRLAKTKGFENISLDLMIAIPEQTKESLLRSIKFCCEVNIQHISSYLLKVEKGTEFYKNRNTLKLKDEDEQAELYLLLCETLKSYGFNHYEISNFSKPGYQSAHNLKYWNANEYIGIGPSAHSFLNGTRFYYKRDLKSFFNTPKVIYDGKGGDEQEYSMLRLRLSEGLKNHIYKERFAHGIPRKYFKNAKFYEQYGLVRCTEDSISLTDKGFLVSNKLISEIIQ